MTASGQSLKRTLGLTAEAVSALVVGQKWKPSQFIILIAMGLAVLLAPVAFRRIAIEQETREFQALSAMLARAPNVQTETFDDLASLLQVTASDCVDAAGCNGKLREENRRARTVLAGKIHDARLKASAEGSATTIQSAR